MGLLDTLTGRQSGGGGMSPLTIALLALLAYRTYQGKGRLADMLGRDEPGGADAGTKQAGRRVSGQGGLPAGNPAGPMGGDGGGLGDILRDLMGGGSGAGRHAGSGGMGGGGIGDLLRGGLGGLLGGAAAGTVLNGGLNDLLQRLQQNGYGDRADSWISGGPNREIAPQDLESALGRDTVQDLADRSGRPYMDVLSELSRSLPDAVDQLTPEGRMPTDDEANRWL